MLPGEGRAPRLDDLAFDLSTKAAQLAGRVHPLVAGGVGALVRSMNCYYSNLIEGHDTYPLDIERALRADYAGDRRRRDLQLEARAHIELQTTIDDGVDPPEAPTSRSYLTWLHAEFLSKLPADLRAVPSKGGKRRLVEPGAVRRADVVVGRHVPPRHQALDGFLARFAEAYSPHRLSKPRQVIAVAAAHHRFLWIHPFDDGNGRVARLASHAALRRLGVGGSLWSVARGLARSVDRYRQLLEAADEPRRGDLDGRGTLTEAGLVAFCAYFLETAIDQVEFMATLFDFGGLTTRLERYCAEEEARTRLSRGAYPVLREALLAGEVPRGMAPALTGHADRQARTVVSDLLGRGLLRSDGPRAPLRLAFPATAAVRWFPGIYPAQVEARLRSADPDASR